MNELARKGALSDVARTDVPAEQRELIRQTIAPNCTQAEFDLFLEIAQRYGLNPLHGEIYAAKMPSRDGGGGKFTPIVGRDGFLAIANRHPDFKGIEADVVHEFDDFKRNADGTVSHTYELGSGGQQPEKVEADPVTDSEPGTKVTPPTVRKRGNIVGAWAIVHRAGRVPTYFFAPFHEYNTGKSAWRGYPDAMIRKVAVANALREAFNLSGLYHEAELGNMAATAQETYTEEAWSDDPELAARLESLVQEAQEVLPGQYRPARVKMMLAHASDQERTAFADTLAEKINEARAAASEEEDVVDAEVVPEEAPQEAQAAS